jgi:hypothetical protein
VKRPRRDALFIGFLALLICALGLTGVYEGPNGHASAATDATAGVTVPSSSSLLAYAWSPADGATGVAVNTAITVRFNRDLAPATITSDSFYITKQGSPSPLAAVALFYSDVTDTATIAPEVDLLPGTAYVVTITDAVKSSDYSLSLDNAGSWSFTTDTPPQILTMVPVPGATNVPVAQTISILFSKTLDAATVDASSIRLVRSSGMPVSAAVALSADRRTVTLDPSLDLTGAETYTIRVSGSVKSESGLSVVGAPVEWSFVTSAAPNVIAKVPAAGAINQALTQTITATFDQDIDQSTLTTATFYVAKPGGTPLPATLYYSANTRTAYLNPLGTLQAGATYQVTLSTAVKGTSGASLAGAPVTWSFTTIAAPPVLTVRLPEDGATNVSTNQSIQVLFDIEMDPASINAATFYVQPTGGAPLAATVTYDAGSRVATIDPAAPLEYGKTYQVTLSAAVESLTGLSVNGAPIIWFFTTEHEATSFVDVIPGFTPHSAAIATLAARDVITGFTDGTFRPDDVVTRQQFAKMIVLTLGLPVSGYEVCPFKDVPDQIGLDPFYPLQYVAVCSLAGITQGKTPTTFAPADNITRQQLITMVVRAAGPPPTPAGFTPPFNSAQFSTPEHYRNARTGAAAGLLDGLMETPVGYRFLAPSTRGECAQLLYNLMRYLD